MNNQKYRIVRLISFYLAGRLSGEEELELRKWLELKEENRLFFQRMCENNNFRQKLLNYKNSDWEVASRVFETRVGIRKSVRLSRISRYAALFIIPLSIAASLLFFYDSEEVFPEVGKVLPICGTSSAVLTLGDGKQVVLTGEDSTTISLQQNIILSGKEKQLVYKEHVASPVQNTLRTPRGGEYKVLLSDGTFVHLNAATELKYPVVFDREKREVHLSGEAWFEVAKDADRPFYVITDEVRIRVYGTEFNVNTLPKERVETVLVNGVVGISPKEGGDEVVLKPSQLGSFDKASGQISVRNVDVVLYAAWKDGLFVFSGESLEKMLDRLGMWYDVDVFYTKESLKNIRFSGYLERYDDIRVILKAIQETVSVHFSVTGRTIVVSE